MLTVTAQLEHEGSGYAVTKAKIAAEGKPICDAELRFRIMPFPEGMDGLMRAQARRIGLARGDVSDARMWSSRASASSPAPEKAWRRI